MYLVRPSYLIKKFYPRALWRKDVYSKKLYLTFDDGPVPGVTTSVLDILKEKNIKATFFCVGENVEKYPAIFQRIINEGHAAGNHTFNHVNGWNTSPQTYIQNVEACHSVIERHRGFASEEAQSNLFRPPYGKMKRSQRVQLEAKYSIVMWDVLSGDYDKNTSPEKCLKNVTDHARNGSVIVFHDSTKAQKNMEYAMPRFIDNALSRGFTFELLQAQ